MLTKHYFARYHPRIHLLALSLQASDPYSDPSEGERFTILPMRKREREIRRERDRESEKERDQAGLSLRAG